MEEQTLVHKPLPQNPDIWVSVPDYKEPILPVAGGFGWYGLMSYDFQGEKLMCHECGKFWDGLALHIKDHKLSKEEYTCKYGLLKNAKLVSPKVSTSYRNSNAKTGNGDTSKEFLDKMRSKRDPNKQEKRQRLEFLNKNDTCPAQLIRWLKEAAQIYGNGITTMQANEYRGGLVKILAERFSSFNKAKQIAKLVTNQAGGSNFKIDKNIILEDMIAFCRKYHHWPSNREYQRGLLICSHETARQNGGLIKLRQEAQQLKDEQDKRASIDINAIANRIEMEYAGRARV